MVVGAHHVSAVDVLYTLGSASGAASVEDVQRVLRVHLFCGTIDAAVSHQLFEIDIFPAKVFRRTLTTPDNNLFHQIHVLDCLVAYSFQVYLFAAAVANVGGDHHLGLGILYAASQ